MKITDIILNENFYFDGAMGTMLLNNGLAPGEKSEKQNIDRPEKIIEIHKQYLLAGADIISANTFGANRFNFPEKCGKYTVENIVSSAVKNVKQAMKDTGRDKFVALDIGSTGKLLKPYGDLDFEEAVEVFSEMIIAGEKAGADLVLIETMTDCYETKAAVIAAKENCSLPILVSNVYDENGKTMSGSDVLTMVSILESLGVDAIGVNCSLGPKQIFPIAESLVKYASVPVFANPNAGLPREENGKLVYDIDDEEFSDWMVKYKKAGVRGLGGCCGTTPKFIEKTVEKTKNLPAGNITKKDFTVVSSHGKSVVFGDRPVIIGERINPTGKPKFKQALKENNISYILGEATSQEENHADILDVNVGLPEIDEAEMLTNAIKSIQSNVDLPLQIDTSDFTAMEKAMRIYNGKPMINSVNGKEETMKAVFPLVKKYGGVVVALTLDENGIPDSADNRVKIAEKIIKTAESYGIDKKNIVVDTLTLTVSSDGNSAKTTLEAVKKVKEKTGVKTVLGVSNISFGLPHRDNVNSAFFTLAMENGLDSAIINPFSQKMMEAYFGFCALNNCKNGISDYISFAQNDNLSKEIASAEMSLSAAIEKGLKDKSADITAELLKEKEGLEIIENEIIPALDRVGTGFENKTVFLPQLLMCAEAAKESFNVIKSQIKADNTAKKGKILLATVKGDIHDIGKNIVKTLLENYGYEVIDLGKDVPPQTIVDTVKEQNIPIVGLSALMTTTVPSMKDTIDLLKKSGCECKTVVGGAVLTGDYADMIGADKYSADAMETVRYAEKILNNK